MRKVFFSEKKLNKNFISKCTGIYIPMLILLILLIGGQSFFANSNTRKITLPQKVEGIEKIEYMINGVPRGSTSGKETIAVESDSTINFLIKIKPDYYEKLYVKDVNIVSDSSKPLKLGVYKLNKDGNTTIVYPPKDELINPDQTYVSQPYTVYRDEIFKVDGVVADTFDTYIKLDSSEYSINDALSVTYQTANKDKALAEYSHEDNSYIIKNITVNSKLKIQINPQEAYSQSSPLFFKDGEEMVPTKDGSITISAVKKDNEITVKNIYKNKYSLVFENYSGIFFKYKKENSGDEFENINSGALNAIYGESFLFTFENTEENFLNEKEITVNDVTVRPHEGMYRLGNIRENKIISVKNKVDSSYEISLPSESSGAYITDESDTRINFAKVNYGSSYSFKLSALEGYTQGIDNALIYAVPTEKLENNDYDIEKDLSESHNYLLTPSTQGVFTINEVKEPISLVIRNLNLNTYKMVLPESLSNGTYTVSETDTVKKISDTTYAVTHGSSAQVIVTPAQGKSTLRMNFECDDPEIEISHEQNVYTVKNIKSDIGIAMSGITDSEHTITFDGIGSICRNEYGIVYENNQGFITDKTGIIKFSVGLSDSLKYEMTSEAIEVNIESGKATLTAPQNVGEYYTLSDAEEDVKIAITGIKEKEISISINSDENAVKIKSVSGEEPLPTANSIAYGSDFNFKVEPAQGTDISNVSVMLNSQEEISPIAIGSNVYSLENVSEDTQIQIINNSSVINNSETESPNSATTHNGDFSTFANGKANYPDKCFYSLLEGMVKVKSESNAKDRKFKINKIKMPAHKDYTSNPNPQGDCEINYVRYDSCGGDHYSDGSVPLSFGDTIHENGNTYGQEEGNMVFWIEIEFEAFNDGIGIESLEGVKITASDNNDTKTLGSTSEQQETFNNPILKYFVNKDTHYNKTIEIDQVEVGIYAIVEMSDVGSQPINKKKATITFVSYPVSKWDINRKCGYDNNVTYNSFVGGDDSQLRLIYFKELTFTPVVNENAPVDSTINFYNPPEGVDYFEAIPLNGKFVSGEKFQGLTQRVSKPTNNSQNPYYFIVRFAKYYDLSKDAKSYIYLYPKEYGIHDSIKLESADIDVEEDENYYYRCYKLYEPYSPNISLSISNLTTKSYKISCYGEGNIYTDSNKDQFLERSVRYGEDFYFKLQSKDYYKSFPRQITVGVGNKHSPLSITDDGLKDENGKTFLSAEYFPDFADAFEKVNIKNKNDTLEFTFYNIRKDISIYSSRDKVEYNLTYKVPIIGKNKAIKYTVLSKDNVTISEETVYKVTYQDEIQFTVTPEIGYDTSNMIVTANNIPINLINGKYTISITGDTEIKATNISVTKHTISFTKYEHLEFKDKNSQPLGETNEVDHDTEYTFRISLDESHSDSQITLNAEYLSSDGNAGTIKKFLRGNGENDEPYVDENGVYHIKMIGNVRIYVSDGLQPNMCKINLVPIDGIDYYDQFQNEKLIDTPEVAYGSNFSFKIVAKEGYDISNLKVYDKSDKIDSPQNQLLSANNIYTIENINANHTVTLSNVKKSVCKIEFRVVEGGKCLDDYGNEITQAEVSYNSDYSFKLSIDTAYNKSNPTVTIKGVATPVSPNPDGSYTLHSIKENIIVEIIDITKNSYTATFQPAEGVIYKTAKNKPFTEPQNVEYNGSYYFKVSLMDAYDQSVPLVLLNDEKILGENGGLYNITNIQDDVVITVKNVKKNPEEVTMDNVIKIPDEIASENDINDVIKATLAYDSLSDEEKAQVTNSAKLKDAQKKSGELNHSTNGISIVGVDWNIKLIVTPLSEDKEKMEAFAAKVDRRSLLSLYEMKLINVLTSQEYEVPYGQKVYVNMPVPDLTEYKNIVVAHEKKSGSMEYLDVNIVDNTAQFQTSSFSMFGIAAKKIPNYSENPSDVQIAVSDLVENEEELKSLLGEGLVSQLGDLMDKSEDNDSETDTSSGDNAQISDNTSDSSSSADKNLGIKNVDLTKAYNWAVDHEFISVILILIVGSALIWIILRMSQRKNEEEEKNTK